MTAELPPEVEAIALKVLETEVKKRQAAVKAIVGQRYDDGDKRAFRSPLGDTRLGTVYRSDPEPAWQVTDPDALHTWLADQPDYVEHTVEIVGDQAEVLAVLADHAPHLLADVIRVRESAVAEILGQAKTTGATDAPGIERVKPAGTLTVRPEKGAYEAVAALVAANLLTWDGRPALPPAEGESAA